MGWGWRAAGSEQAGCCTGTCPGGETRGLQHTTNHHGLRGRPAALAWTISTSTSSSSMIHTPMLLWCGGLCVGLTCGHVRECGDPGPDPLVGGTQQLEDLVKLLRLILACMHGGEGR